MYNFVHYTLRAWSIKEGEMVHFTYVRGHVGHKNGATFIFYDNFGKCGPISIILSLLDS